ncbi:cytochrome P450 CYP72A219-like isoform X1 [Vitis riparia]|uniref:cytochrome P450 CYP72A219-like isoform X1 n=1 Tax=Vitis riparia TaxID=96939 RepID=UPI00155AD2E7|nr:cytochrome P450 CYP72A219-like isoform X1 [Vitis riparia]
MKLSSVAISFAFITLLVYAWRLLNWVWLRPKKLERCLRQQGLTGNSYRLLHGDFREMLRMISEANSRPISLSDDIVQRVLPFHYHSIKKYGKNYFIWMGPKPVVNIMDPELIRDVFLKYNAFRKPPPHPLGKLLATGLVTLEGEQWTKRRKIINPAFHLEKLKHMVPAFQLSCSDMVNKWEKKLSKDGSCELDIWPDLENLAGDAISRTAFGSSYEEGRRIFQLQKEQAHLAVKVFRSVYIPGWRFVPTKTNKRMRQISNEVHALLKGIIERRERAMKVGETANDDLLSLLMESNFREMQEHDERKNVGMSVKDVIEECKLFYFAGQETTSDLLLWTMVLLSKHSNWQARAREEVLQVFGNKKPDGDGLNHLKIVTMIFHEVLRLYPPVSMLIRTVVADSQVGGWYFPDGVLITLPILLIHHDHEIWGEDAKEFNPERFSEGVSKATKGQFAFYPFGYGPRVCIGQNFAMMEAKMALAMILQRFSFELSPSYAHAPSNIITIQPQYGAHLILHGL